MDYAILYRPLIYEIIAITYYYFLYLIACRAQNSVIISCQRTYSGDKTGGLPLVNICASLSKLAIHTLSFIQIL